MGAIVRTHDYDLRLSTKVNGMVLMEVASPVFDKDAHVWMTARETRVLADALLRRASDAEALSKPS